MAKIKFYFDEMISHTLAEQLQKRGIEVITAVEADMTDKDDDTEHLPFATQAGCVLFTGDKPFAGRASKLTDHAGVIGWNGKPGDVGAMVKALAEFAENYDAEAVKGQVFWLK